MAIIEQEQTTTSLKLKNYWELEKAVDIPNAALKDKDVLQNMYELARDVQDQRGFPAAAATQFRDDLFLKHSVPKEFTNWMYLGDIDGEFANSLLLNPSVVHRSREKVAMWEVCGSIDDGNTFKIIERSELVSIQAGIYKPNYSSKAGRLTAKGTTAMFIQHEMCHLEGKSAIDTPEDIIDFKATADWSRIDSLMQELGFSIPGIIAFQREYEGTEKGLIHRNGKLMYYHLDTGETEDFQLVFPAQK